MQSSKILLFGGAILDIPLCPVDQTIFENRSTPLERILLSTGGDALNEALVLAALGDEVRLSTVLGNDAAGDLICQRCAQAGIDTAFMVRDPALDTGINVVLVDHQGERRFLTARSGTLRAFDLSHAEGTLTDLTGVGLANFASIFVSPHFTPDKLTRLFRSLKDHQVTVCADMTRCKHGETVEDLGDCLAYVDYLFPNEQEAAAVTGTQVPEEMASRFLEAGVQTVVLKLGASGCLVQNRERSCRVPAYPVTRCVDTTGAGDTFAAGFLHALNQGMDLLDCARFANACASLCVEQIGADGAVQNIRAVWERFQALQG